MSVSRLRINSSRSSRPLICYSFGKQPNGTADLLAQLPANDAAPYDDSSVLDKLMALRGQRPGKLCDTLTGEIDHCLVIILSQLQQPLKVHDDSIAP